MKTQIMDRWKSWTRTNTMGTYATRGHTHYEHTQMIRHAQITDMHKYENTQTPKTFTNHGHTQIVVNTHKPWAHTQHHTHTNPLWTIT